MCVTAGYVFVVMFPNVTVSVLGFNERTMFSLGKFPFLFTNTLIAAALHPVLPAQSKVHCLFDLLLLLLIGA